MFLYSQLIQEKNSHQVLSLRSGWLFGRGGESGGDIDSCFCVPIVGLGVRNVFVTLHPGSDGGTSTIVTLLVDVMSVWCAPLDGFPLVSSERDTVKHSHLLLLSHGLQWQSSFTLSYIGFHVT